MRKRANSGKNPGELVDRISALPNSILSLILSFLPTKNAVFTSVLSKRWEFLWTTVNNLDFYHDEYCRRSEESFHESDMRFIRFVNSVMLLHDVGFINKFRLVCKHMCIPSQINPWISTAITRNVREIVLSVGNSDRPFQMSRRVFSCETLQCLELNGYMFVSAVILVCLPRLERLKLDSVCFQTEEAFEKLISGCPMLKYLHLVLSGKNSDRPFQLSSCVFNRGTLQSLELNGYMFVSAAILDCLTLPRLESLKLDTVCFQSEEAFEKLISRCPMLKYLQVRIDMNKMEECLQTHEGMEIGVFKYVVSSTSLKCLKLCMEPELLDDAQLYCNLELRASSLEHLKLVGFISRIHVQESLSSLVDADFGIKVGDYEWDQPGVGKSLSKAICASSCVKALTLSYDTVSALNWDEICLPTKFERLMKLEAGEDCCATSLVEDIIQRSDNLEVLILGKLSITLGTYFSTVHHPLWTDPVEVPRCLSNRLKVIELTCYTGFDYDRDMVAYMLKHGNALEVVKLSCESCRKDVKYELLQEICKLPRKSPTCKIEFSG